MGKTHFSGVEIGDISAGIYSQVMQAQHAKLGALAPGAFGRLSFLEDTLITQIVVIDSTGALVVATVNIGTSLHGSGIFTGSTTAGAPLGVWKLAGPSQPYIEVTAVTGSFPVDVIVFFLSVTR